MAVIERSSCAGADTSSINTSTTEGEALPPAAFLLMGKTGVGKSSFIKLLGGTDVYTGKEPDVESGINSSTLKSSPYNVRLHNRRIILIDTPGFDDSTRTNIELLQDIVSHLWGLAINQDKSPLHGIIFLHDISETRFNGSQKKTLSIMRQICGPHCIRNVIVGTTKWIPESKKRYNEQQKREGEIIREHWGGIHSTVRLFEDDHDAAANIITTLLSASPILLQVQEEMLRPPHAVGETTVGKELLSEGEKECEKLKQRGDTKEAGYFENLLKSLGEPSDWTFSQKFGAAIAAPIILAPAAAVAAPLGVIYALVHGVDYLTSRWR